MYWSFFPSCGVVLPVREHGTYIDLLAVEVKRGDEACFVAAEVEDGELSHEISAWEGLAQVREDLRVRDPADQAAWPPGIYAVTVVSGYMPCAQSLPTSTPTVTPTDTPAGSPTDTPTDSPTDSPTPWAKPTTALRHASSMPGPRPRAAGR